MAAARIAGTLDLDGQVIDALHGDAAFLIVVLFRNLLRLPEELAVAMDGERQRAFAAERAVVERYLGVEGGVLSLQAIAEPGRSAHPFRRRVHEDSMWKPLAGDAHIGKILGRPFFLYQRPLGKQARF